MKSRAQSIVIPVPIRCARLESDDRIGWIDELTSHYKLIPDFLTAAEEEEEEGKKVVDLRATCKNTIVTHKHTIDLGGEARPDYTQTAWFSIADSPVRGNGIAAPRVECIGERRVSALFDVTLRFEVPPPKPPQMLMFRALSLSGGNIVDDEVCIPYMLLNNGTYRLPFTIARPLLIHMMQAVREVTRFTGGGRAELRWSTVTFGEDVMMRMMLHHPLRFGMRGMRVRHPGFTLQYERGGYVSVSHVSQDTEGADYTEDEDEDEDEDAFMHVGRDDAPILSVCATIPFHRYFVT